MKKLLLVVVAVMAVMTAGVAMAAISGTAHDLSDQGASPTTEICVFCHTPHGTNVGQGPIWNRSTANADPYVMYDIVSSNTDSNPSGISASSKACMTCHDGATALNALMNNPGLANAAVTPSGDLSLSNGNIGGASGRDLSNDHPIAVAYDGAGATSADNKASLNPLTDINAAYVTVKIYSTDGVTGSVRGATNNATLIQCESCHDVHGADSAFGVVPSFLRVWNSDSALCLTCHDK